MSIWIVRLPSKMEYWKAETRLFAPIGIKRLFFEEDSLIFFHTYALEIIKENVYRKKYIKW